jgi:hypothetical protein
MLELLVDADSAIYKAGCANETRSYHIVDVDSGIVINECTYKKEADAFVDAYDKSKEGAGAGLAIKKHKVAGPLSHTLANVKNVVKNMLSLEHTDRQFFIGGKGNFRYDIYPEYKGKREPADKPIHEQEIREYLIKHYDAQLVDDEEADDRVSYLQCLSEPGSTCIVSIDKDLLNTPGYNYNYDKRELIYITPEDADLNFARQLLTGDSTDNIPGLKGVGKGRALKLLPEYTPDWLSIVREEYGKHYPAEEVDGWINLNGSLLWMRREPNEIWSVDYGNV